MQKPDREIAYAKINLALHVRERLPNGYHSLETLFAFVDRGDVITVAPSEELSLELCGPFGLENELDTKDNLVIKAAALLADYAQIAPRANITLNKKLPIASGIGGGSADAAATLRLLNRFWKLGLSQQTLAELSQPLGADVPACVFSKTILATGIGQDFTVPKGQPISGLPVLLVNPRIKISTGEIFAAWDGRDGGPLNVTEPPLSIAQSGRNDLEPVAIVLVPQIADVLAMLKKTGPIMSRMSGSGATCFALYENREQLEAAHQYAIENFSEWWTLAGELR